MPIENAVFDAVGTVIRPTTNVSRTYWEAGVNHGSCRTLSEIEQSFWPLFEQANVRRSTLATSETAEKSFWNEVISSIFTDVDFDTQLEILDHLWKHFAKSTSWQLFPDVLASMRELKRAGVGVAIASNFDCRLHQICQDLFPNDLTVQVFESASIGYRKPAAQFFQRVVAKIGCPANRLVMIGDDFETDVCGAKEFGCQALLIDRSRNCNAHHGTTNLEPRRRTGVIYTLAELPQLLAEMS